MSHLEFNYPLNYIYLILPAIMMVVLIMGYRKKGRILNRLRLDSRLDFKTSRLLLTTLGMVLIVVSLLGPQIFQGYSQVKKEGLDIYVLIDTSRSMLVEDVKPDRISRAKKIVDNLLNNLKGDRIGFIPFSSDAYIQMPLTDDYQLARMYLQVIDTEMIAGGGTNIAAALNLADNSFERTASNDRVVIILSDGEEHDASGLEELNLSQDLKVYTIGIGTDQGGLIPVYNPHSQNRTGYKKNQQGEFVVSHLTGDTLKSLAASAEGKYYQATLSGDEISELIHDISSLKRDLIKTDKIKRFKQLYQYFLGAGLLLFIAGYLLPERRKRS